VSVPDAIPKVQIALWRSDAVILFDWLMTVDLNAVPINHPAEKQALADLLTRLEETEITDVTQAESTSPGPRSRATWAGNQPNDRRGNNHVRGVSGRRCATLCSWLGPPRRCS
jgi:hypothetical protein